MGKIRDWWPSDDLLERRKSAAASATSPKSAQCASVGTAAALRLSEVAAALNALPSQSSGTASDIATPPAPPILSRPVVKLANTQDHKDELLRKLLQRSASSTDLASKPPPSPRSPGSSRSSKSASVASDRQRKRGALHELQEKPIQKDNLSRREIHIYSERQRRKGMTHLYATLHSLLPEAKPKTDRCTVLTEAMDYIQCLRRKLEDLGRQKSEILFSLGDHFSFDPGTSAVGGMAHSSNSAPVELSDEARAQLLSAADVAVRFCGRDAFITLNSPKKKGVWSGVLQIFHEQEMELLNVTLSSSMDMDYHCIHAKMHATSELRSQELQKMIQDLVLSRAACE